MLLAMTLRGCCDSSIQTPPSDDCCDADVMAVRSGKSLLCCSGYGFYRPQMALFDPGWRGEQAKGPEDWGVADLGNDPMGIIDRYVLLCASFVAAHDQHISFTSLDGCI